MAVVRVKRRLIDDPVEALLLTCKRLKTEDGPCTAVFKFAATVENQDEDVSAQLKQALKSTGSGSYKQHTVRDVTAQTRKQTRLSSQQSRLKVVNCFRSIESSDAAEGSDGQEKDDGGKTLAVLDMVTTLEATSTQDSDPASPRYSDESEKYVYDLYYANYPDVDDSIIDKFLSGHWSNQELMFEHYKEALDDSSDPDDEDDSNDEDNWRNDYPDEDEFSIDEDDMKLAMKMDNFTIDDRSDLSSDDEDENLVYGSCADPKDVYLYGKRYANYKAKMNDELNDGISESSGSD